MPVCGREYEREYANVRTSKSTHTQIRVRLHKRESEQCERERAGAGAGGGCMGGKDVEGVRVRLRACV